MSNISKPTPDNLKSKAKIARQFLKEKCNVDISHSQSIELISKVFGFKDWNTASAELSKNLALLESKNTKDFLPSGQSMTVGEIRKVLSPFDDSATVDFDYEYNLGEFMDSIDDFVDPEGTIHQEFGAIAFENVDTNYVSMKLALKNESLSSG